LSAVVRYGDGWINGTNPAPEFVAERRSRLRALAIEAGRDPAEIRVAVPLMAHLSRDRERSRASINGYIARGDFGRWLGDFFGDNARRYGLWGTPEDALARLRPYLEIGVRDFIFDLRPPSIAEETAELLAEHVLPGLADI
jgi:alkanesulfonate monooxygenase SsuD/methylene tetrahydromethanopterin reductase-like flavin-dependent oxidoreductase (luciferase family)